MELVKMCRVCLCTEEQVRLLDWYQPIDSLDYVLSYKECFCKCTQINLNLKEGPNEKEDVRTQFLCVSCAHKLTDAYEFIEKAKKADIELRGMEVDKIFEWVAVNVKDVESDDLPLDNENNLDGAKSTIEWRDPSIDGKGNIISDEIVREGTTNDNLIKDEELNEYNKVSMDEAAKVFANENSCSKDLSRKKLQTKNGKISSTRHKKNNLKRDTSVDDLVSCEICSKRMKRKSLKQHKRFHKPKALLCQACPKTFNDLGNLKTHELTHEKNREKIPCDKCHQTFSTPYSLRNHMVTHDNNRKPLYKCAQCEKSFLNKSGLLIHELYHKEAKFECNICKKRYVQQRELDVHLRTHSGETPFICNICGSSFNYKKVLNKHMQRHDNGIFRYTCLTCGEEFSKYDVYYKHRMKHTGLPYKCGICEKLFSSSYRIKCHIKGVHKIHQDNEVKKTMVRVNDTKEYRGRIVEVLKDPDDIVNQNE